MYTVMIVEDELLVRMGLMASIPWEELGLRVVAEAANGQDAWKAYQKYHPDIVMTDIRIPGMNGLELLSAVREIDPSCALIVITCVEEFSTLQETMSLGVVSYLVKATMRQQDIIVAVKKAYSFLQNNNRPPNSKSCEDEIETLIGAYFLGSIDYEVLMRRGNGDLQPEIHGFLYMRMSRTGGMTEILRRSIQNILQDRLARADAITLAWREDGILVLIRKQTQRESLRASLEGIRHYCTEMFGVEARFNACLDAVPVRSLPKAVERIVENYTEAYLYESSLLWVRPDGGISDEVVDDCLQMLRDNIWLFRDAGSVSEVRSQIDRLEADLYRGWTALSSAAYFLARYIASHAPAVTEEMFREFCHRMKEDTSLHALFIHLREQIVRPALEGQAIRPEIARAVSYMARNLCSDISLTQVALAVGLHPTYLSRLFKLELGKGFSEFLTDLRIEQAQALLKKHALSIQEVSEMCGFSDISYFCRKFKSVVGVSPSAWRAR